jgi:uncharacterized pyridoxal phosphate-containing UPF0001 family protein
VEKNVISLLIYIIVEKAGVAPNDVVALVQYIVRDCPHLNFSGLMTIGSMTASLSAQEQQENPDFEVDPSLLHLMGDFDKYEAFDIGYNARIR